MLSSCVSANCFRICYAGAQSAMIGGAYTEKLMADEKAYVVQLYCMTQLMTQLLILGPALFFGQSNV